MLRSWRGDARWCRRCERMNDSSDHSECALLDYEVSNPDATRIRSASRDVLSLALIDSRNHTLRWISALETGLGGAHLRLPDGTTEGIAARSLADLEPLLWTLGRIGWYAE